MKVRQKGDPLQWEDVTNECMAYKGEVFTAPGPSGIPLSQTTPGSYRLHKVWLGQLCQCKDPNPRFAFIVERRVLQK